MKKILANAISFKRHEKQPDRERALPSPSKEDQLREIKWNFAAICATWLFTYTSFSGLQYLVVIKNNDLMKATLTALSGGSTVVFLFGPFIMHHVGAKRSMIFAWLCLSVFALTNYKPKDGILIPGGLIEGLGFGCMWTAQGVYLTNEAVRYANVTGASLEYVLNIMWGVFTMFWESTQIWSNLVTSAVLDTLDSNRSVPHHTYTCGVDMCPDTDKVKVVASNITMNITSNISGPDDDEVTHRERSLITIYLLFALAGLVITLLFLNEPTPATTKVETPTTKELLLTAIKFQFLNKDMLLLIPLCMYTGVQQTVLLAEFTKYFVLCELGFGWFVFPILCFGFSGAVFSMASGTVSKYISRPMQFILAAALNLIILIVLFLWTPRSSEKMVFFLIPFIWGISEAVWLTQSAVLFSSVFTDQKESAFASLRMFQVTGQNIAYKYHKHLCVDVKLSLCLGLLLVSLVITSFFELRDQRNKKLKRYQELAD